MEKETELTQSRNTEPGLHSRGGISFKVPQVVEDFDDTASLKQWQPVPPSPPRLPGSVRTRFSPLDELVAGLPHNGIPTKLPEDTQAFPGEVEDGFASAEEEEEEEEEEVVPHHRVSHHQHNISLANGIAPQPKGGIAFDISLDDVDCLPRPSTGSSRRSSLRVSFIDEMEMGSPSPTRAPVKSPTGRSNGTNAFGGKKSNHSKPAQPWESSTKIGTPAPSKPKKTVQPTLHGIKVKRGPNGTRSRGGGLPTTRSSLPSLEIENEYRSNSNLVGADGRQPGQVTRSWDQKYFASGGEYDSVSKLISSSLMTPNTSDREDTSKPGSRPFQPQTNGGRKHNEDDDNADVFNEDAKKAMLCGGGVNETSRLTGDFGRLFSKLRRASAPLAKPSVTKSQSAAPLRTSTKPVQKISRANSGPAVLTKTSRTNPTPTLAMKKPVDSSAGAQKYTIGSYASLKLLQECCSTEKPGVVPAPAYSAQKPRKIRDHEPHRHYYKTISKTLDQKLKS